MKAIAWTIAACGAVGFAAAAQAQPQTPAAVVEEVKGKVAGVEFMDYVAPGQVIRLGVNDAVVLGYLKSCWRETIAGNGTVVVGEEQSLVHLSRVERSKTDCDQGQLMLTSQEANQSAATVFRSMTPVQRAEMAPRITLYGLSPVIDMKRREALVIERLDQPGERYDIATEGKTLARGRFYDFASEGKALVAGATYAATLGTRMIVFRIDDNARPGATPIVGRLLRFD